MEKWVEALSLRSSLREKILEHRFLSDIASELWSRGVFDFGIARGEVDDSGYDVVFELGSLVRHIQLKAKHIEGRTARYAVQTALGERPSGCVVVMVHHPRTLAVDHYRFFGGPAGHRLPELSERAVRHTKGDSEGVKSVRPRLRSVPLGAFRKVADARELVDLLFGTEIEIA